jgi:hypothetical protein
MTARPEPPTTDRVLAAVRSVSAGIPVPRVPADDRSDGWERHGDYEIHFDNPHTTEENR